MMSDVAKTPREELECEKKYLYEYSMFWECNDGSKCQILEDDVVRLLNEQQDTISQLQDLCGESDGENAKLRIENKKLKEINEQLKDDVYDTLDKALKTLEEIYDDYPKNSVHRLYNDLKGLKEMI